MGTILKACSVTAILAVAVIYTGVESARAASPNGTWLRPKTGAHVLAFKCRGGLGLKVVKSKKKSSVGTVIMCGAKKTAANKWQGNLKSTEDGNVYSGYVTLTGSNKMKLQGCALGFLCKTEYWSRLK